MEPGTRVEIKTQTAISDIKQNTQGAQKFVTCPQVKLNAHAIR
jgi:hypothetical protein